MTRRLGHLGHLDHLQHLHDSCHLQHFGGLGESGSGPGQFRDSPGRKLALIFAIWGGPPW